MSHLDTPASVLSVCLILEMEPTANGSLLIYTFSPESPTTKIQDHFPTILLKLHSLGLIDSNLGLIRPKPAPSFPSRRTYLSISKFFPGKERTRCFTHDSSSGEPRPRALKGVCCNGLRPEATRRDKRSAFTFLLGSHSGSK